MAKVLIDGRVLAHSRISGVERYVTEICRALQEVDSKHSFVIGRPPSGSKLLHHAWEHIYLPVLCLKEKADLLFCPANIGPIVKPIGIKLVVTIHGLAFRYYPQVYARGFRYYYSSLMPRILRSADAIVAVSEVEKKNILSQYNWLDPKKVFAVRSGINHDMFKVESKEKAKAVLRQQYGITGKFVLSVGSFTEIKNSCRLIKAFLPISDRAGVSLVLITGGLGPYRYQAGEAIKDPRVKMVGYVGRDLPAFYQAAELSVVPSKYEGFGFPPLEAMACGCAVLVSKVGALPEICGDAALYVDPEETQSITDGMYDVLSNEHLRQDLIRKGLRKAKLFDWQATVKNTIEVFDRVLSVT